jgi:hypothetical protein
MAGEGRYFVAVFRAHAAFIAWLFSAKKTGRLPKKKVRLQGYLRKSVVWAHFIEGKKKFSEIVNTKS